MRNSIPERNDIWIRNIVKIWIRIRNSVKIQIRNKKNIRILIRKKVKIRIRNKVKFGSGSAISVSRQIPGTIHGEGPAHLSPDEALCAVHSDGPNGVLPEVLGNLNQQK